MLLRTKTWPKLHRDGSLEVRVRIGCCLCLFHHHATVVDMWRDVYKVLSYPQTSINFEHITKPNSPHSKYWEFLASSSQYWVMSDFLQPVARRRHGKRQTDVVILDEGEQSSSQNNTDSSGNATDSAKLQTLSVNRAGSSGRSDNCCGEDKRSSEWAMQARSFQELVSQSGNQRNAYDENFGKGDESKMCF